MTDKTKNEQVKKGAVNKAKANAEKQRRFRERQKDAGKKLVRGYVTPEAKLCYDEIRDKTGWTDSEAMSNAMRLMYAAYKCGQIKLLNEWLRKNER
ncbi:hypothetical protein KUL42_31970 [Alteromonas sp. KUL42]|uniref:hypothetical protein n=1 Tax=Alteromonas sp. KUL42 TaxID=2480797 RepID=UPI000796CC69|nr:hypothetical protein [Alteromonas sp. KUL42]KXJ61747.1 MAG: hypothetical protein AXW14_08230 [Alteromonas sp. Nap_26]TAP33221.1 hypothetical protein EYR97_15050 [Alteromonas sp. KUL42]GEA08436.1 hypothetical protein KUL42_31970 [Alteromonas sp. KUL42]